MIICILGRQPRLGLAELESLYGAKNVTFIEQSQAALVNVSTIERELGGSIKVATVLDTVDLTQFDTIAKYIAKNMARYLSDLASEGKVKLGLSLYGFRENGASVSRTGLFLKKAVRSAGRSVRVVPNNEPALNSAQVLHNQLTGDLGIEFVLVRDGNKTHICKTTREQDIDAYTLRDRSRPKRDAFVGMLPPKLAQIMINLAPLPLSTHNEEAASVEEYLQPASDQAPVPLSDPARSHSYDKGSSLRLLDPFCGTGVVLQEAALYGYEVYGSDLSEKMVRYTRDNLVWLTDTHSVHPEKYFEVADATNHTWQQPVDLVVGEGYLGRPIGGQSPSREQLAEIMHESNAIYRGFFKNIAPQLQPGTPLVIAAPAWHLHGEVYHLPCLDEVEEIGFMRHQLTHANAEDLIYHREDQPVGRELVILTKK